MCTIDEHSLTSKSDRSRLAYRGGLVLTSEAAEGGGGGGGGGGG